MRGFIAALALTTALWGQDKPKAPSTAEAAEQVRTIQTKLLGPAGNGDWEAEQAQREKISDGIKEIVSSYVIARIEASPEINWWELRDGLIQVLGVKYDERGGPDAPFRQPPYVFLSNPASRKSGPVVFSVVYGGDVCLGSGCARIVVESYVIDHGKARLSGRGGAELNGIEGRAQQVGTDELLVQGQYAWASGHVLPYGAALYRVSDGGVSTVWQAPITPELSASVFGGHLLVQYYDEKRNNFRNYPLSLDVYSLDEGVPKLVFHREWE